MVSASISMKMVLKETMSWRMGMMNVRVVVVAVTKRRIRKRIGGIVGRRRMETRQRKKILARTWIR